MEHVKVDVEYLSVGANRQSAAGDWNIDGTVAFGADTNIALWRPNDSTPRGIRKLLSGHGDVVKAVKFLPGTAQDDTAHLLSGSDDKCVKLWKLDLQTYSVCWVHTVQSHTAPINCIATLPPVYGGEQSRSRIFATGAADATIKIWSVDGGDIKVIQTIKMAPKYFPLAVALSPLGDGANTFILASAGTKDIIQIYTGTLIATMTGVDTTDYTTDFSLRATLTGHEGWIRSLDFTPETPASPSGSDLLLASASQDKYIRLWRIHQGTELPAQAATASDPTVGAYLPGRSPANKAHRFTSAGAAYSITFESLLFNHDDWIYSAKWHASSSSSSSTTLSLLSTSADNSLAIWAPDPSTGIWLTTARLGEISREKGATTATGSIGGFWTGLWSPTGTSILTLGRTGSWRRWDLAGPPSSGAWTQALAVSGHTKPVTGIAWSRGSDDAAAPGAYLLSTSADQTTRLHARAAASATWHEMARPQIHGYDLNCIDALSATRFVSGADEKLMRVFGAPRAVAKMLHAVAGIGPAPGRGDDGGDTMPDAANMPVLGLSNKATVDEDDDDDEPAAPRPGTNAALVGDLAHPPFEEALSRHTLWPELEKLYGHGYELSCLAASHDGALVASACRASSLNHAVVRVFETARWTELRPPLAAHTLTATRLRFSGDDRFLLSVGRDRQWAVYERRRRGAAAEGKGEMGLVLVQSEAKAHARMILDGAWGPVGGGGEGEARVFATAGRDKSVKVWAMQEDGKFGLAATVADEHPVTAVDFLPRRDEAGHLLLASGNDAGKIKIHAVKVDGSAVSVLRTFTVQPELCLPKAVLQLAWRPSTAPADDGAPELAIAGDDSSLRIYRIRKP